MEEAIFQNDFTKKCSLISENESDSFSNERMEEKEKEIKNLLDDEFVITDLMTNSNSKMTHIITTEFIKILIGFCLYPNTKVNNESSKDLRYPYYGYKLLCSPSILLFSKSIENIKKASSSRKNSEIKNSQESHIINNINNINNNYPDLSDNNEEIKNKENVFENQLDEFNYLGSPEISFYDEQEGDYINFIDELNNVEPVKINNGETKSHNTINEKEAIKYNKIKKKN